MSGVSLAPWAAGHATELPEDLDPESAHWLGAAVPTRSTYAAWLAAGGSTPADDRRDRWAILDVDSATLLGGLSLTRDEAARPGSATLSLWLLPEARGAGRARSATEAAIAKAFAAVGSSGLGLRRLEAAVPVDNRPALRLLRRCGFHETGTARGELEVGWGAGTQAVDAVHLDLLADDDRSQAVEPLTTPVIETPRLRLRAFRDDDGPGPDDGPDETSRHFLPAGAHPDAAAYPAWLARHRRRQDAGECLAWCVADLHSDAALGYLALFRMEALPGRFDAEVGYFLYPGARGHGYLAEALAAGVGHAFAARDAGGLGLTRLHAGTDLDNLASQRVLQQVGFALWGTDRAAWRNAEGVLTDGASYELLASDARTDRRAQGGGREVAVEGVRVRLRPFRDNDVPRIVEACTDPRTRHWLGGLPAPYTVSHAEQYVARNHAQAAAGASLGFAVADAGDDQLLGALTLMDLAGQTPLLAQIGYWAHPAARGRGLMTEAVGLAVRHAFAPRDAGGLGLRRLVLHAAAGNSASQHVALANGFVPTGRQRAAERLGDGTWDDLVDVDLLAEEWEARGD